MSKIEDAISTILNQGVLPLYYNTDLAVSVEILRALYRAGIKAVEYTHLGEEAAENFKAMLAVRNKEMPGLLLGIGTIKKLSQASMYVRLGADFFISPGFIPEVAALLSARKILYIPGCITQTEIIAAENKGVRFIKIFPANTIKPDFLSGIKDVFPDLIFMPTGGIENTEECIQMWFEAGVSAVGMGRSLISRKLIDAMDYENIEVKTVGILNIIRTINN